MMYMQRVTIGHAGMEKMMRAIIWVPVSIFIDLKDSISI